MSIIQVRTRVERKQPDLPRYAVIPSVALAPWKLDGTTVIEVAIDGTDVGRRTVKRWDTDRWFLSVTATDCRAVGIDTGSRIVLTLRLADTGLPGELAKLLATERRALAAWSRLTRAQQRMLREEIAAAKQPRTRERRARRALLSFRDLACGRFALRSGRSGWIGEEPR